MKSVNSPMPLDIAVSDNAALAQAFATTRARSEALAAPLSPEDWMVQSMEEASPVKWNLAHTSWFFETFILRAYAEDYKEFHAKFGFLYNSYYNTIGEMHSRAERGMVSRPGAAEVLAYRAHVTSNITELLETVSGNAARKVRELVALGCVHEEQHQELLLTDIKHALSKNPLWSGAYDAPRRDTGQAPDLSWPALSWIGFDGGIAEIGYDSDAFAFDNEGPRHKVYLTPYELATRMATNAEYIAFIDDGGYDDPAYWLADGWRRVCEENWTAPLYWRLGDAGWSEFTLFGKRPVNPDAPVAHLSFYEAAAFAEWTGYRLPTEFEWEHAARDVQVAGNFLNGVGPKAPAPSVSISDGPPGLQQLYGDAWEWTASPYVAYPGFRAPAGAIGEYNAKFMSSQMVLRGGSCATPEGHVRATYRNFFPPHARWQFSGLRLARDV